MRFFNRLLACFLVSQGVASLVMAQTPAPSADETRARQLLEEKTRELDAAPRPRPAAPAVPADKDLKAQEKARRQAEENARAVQQKLREEQERQERINKIKADLAAQGQAVPATPAKPAAVVAAPPPPAVPPSDAEAQARALLEQKTRELEATPVPAAPPAAPPAPAVVVTPPPPPPAPPAAPAPGPAPSAAAATPATEDATRALLEQRTRDLGGTTPSAAPAKPAAAAAAPARTAPSKSVAPPVVQVPEVPSPLPKTKQQKLAELLETYRLNLITPADYHAARAKILAEP